MTAEEKLVKNLAELSRLADLPLTVTEYADPGEAAEKTGRLLSAWKDRYSRTNFVKHLLEGSPEEADIVHMAGIHHIPYEETRIIYVIDVDGNIQEAEAVLDSMFADGRHDFTEQIRPGRLVLVRGVPAGIAEEERRELAAVIADTLSTEALVRTRVGYGQAVSLLSHFRKSYEEAVTALEIGRIFYSERQVISYTELGVGRLLYQLPKEQCRLFLKESLGNVDPNDFDEETTLTIRTFFEKNLNIAETARKMFLHRNTLVYRIEKLNAQTGLDLRVFDDAMVLRLAMMVAGYLRDKEERS